MNQYGLFHGLFGDQVRASLCHGTRAIKAMAAAREGRGAHDWEQPQNWGLRRHLLPTLDDGLEKPVILPVEEVLNA